MQTRYVCDPFRGALENMAFACMNSFTAVEMEQRGITGAFFQHPFITFHGVNVF